MQKIPNADETMTQYPNIHPGSASLGVSSITFSLSFVTAVIPVLQALALFVSFIAGCFSIYFYVKKIRKGS